MLEIRTMSPMPTSNDTIDYGIRSLTDNQGVAASDDDTTPVQQDNTVGKAVKKPDKKVDKQELDSITKEMNKFMEEMNADLQFSLHEKTHRLIVRLVDVKENKVLKEFPPHEFLDMIARIHDYVGMILDKKV